MKREEIRLPLFFDRDGYRYRENWFNEKFGDKNENGEIVIDKEHMSEEVRKAYAEIEEVHIRKSKRGEYKLPDDWDEMSYIGQRGWLWYYYGEEADDEGNVYDTEHMPEEVLKAYLETEKEAERRSRLAEEQGILVQCF